MCRTIERIFKTKTRKYLESIEIHSDAQHLYLFL